MPYIKQHLRDSVDADIDNLVTQARMTCAGDMDGAANYIISRIVAGLFKPDDGWRYRYMAHAVGCLESVKAEFQRRVISEYEKQAIESNGDIKEYYSPF